jgi:hypothetical protein
VAIRNTLTSVIFNSNTPSESDSGFEPSRQQEAVAGTQALAR